jgi:hypothetical protein
MHWWLDEMAPENEVTMCVLGTSLSTSIITHRPRKISAAIAPFFLEASLTLQWYADNNSLSPSYLYTKPHASESLSYNIMGLFDNLIDGLPSAAYWAFTNSGDVASVMAAVAKVAALQTAQDGDVAIALPDDLSRYYNFAKASRFLVTQAGIPRRNTSVTT